MEPTRLLKIRIEPDEDGMYIPGMENISGMYLLIEKNDTEPEPEPGNNFPVNRFGLSLSEAKVMELVATGLRDKEIADILCKSIWTVKNQKKAIFGKMDVSNRVEAGRRWGRRDGGTEGRRD